MGSDIRLLPGLDLGQSRTRAFLPPELVGDRKIGRKKGNVLQLLLHNWPRNVAVRCKLERKEFLS